MTKRPAALFALKAGINTSKNQHNVSQTLLIEELHVASLFAFDNFREHLLAFSYLTTQRAPLPFFISQVIK